LPRQRPSVYPDVCGFALFSVRFAHVRQAPILAPNVFSEEMPCCLKAPWAWHSACDLLNPVVL
jgi:hypothetical protein